jgi:hypothetical protein
MVTCPWCVCSSRRRSALMGWTLTAEQLSLRSAQVQPHGQSRLGQVRSDVCKLPGRLLVRITRVSVRSRRCLIGDGHIARRPVALSIRTACPSTVGFPVAKRSVHARGTLLKMSSRSTRFQLLFRQRLVWARQLLCLARAAQISADHTFSGLLHARQSADAR